MESQTIDYITNPLRFKEDLDKAKQEIKDIGTAMYVRIKKGEEKESNFLEKI